MSKLPMLDDDEPRSDSLGRLGWYALGQQHERYRRDNDAFIDRITGQAPPSRAEVDALSAENARLINYANQLVQQLDELSRANAVLQEHNRRLQEGAQQAQAELAEHKQAARDLTDETIAQDDHIAELNERIEELKTEFAARKADAIRTE